MASSFSTGTCGDESARVLSWRRSRFGYRTGRLVLKDPDALAAAPRAQGHAHIRAHIERHIGRIDKVFRGAACGTASIDVNHVAPTETRPVHTLLTAGMSDLPMCVPAEVDAPRCVELMMTLPRRWQLDEKSIASPEWSWPIQQLQTLSCFPHEHQTWLGWGHTIPNGEPPQAFAPNTRLCGVIIAPSLLVPVTFYELDTKDQRIGFFSAIPLYREELELKEKDGMEALLAKLVEHDINDVVEPKRRNVAKRFLGWF